MTYETDLKKMKAILNECKVKRFTKEQVYEWIKFGYITGRKNDKVSNSIV